MTIASLSRIVLAGSAAGPVVATDEGLSFWGGVEPETGKVIDIHHPLNGSCLTGCILFMPTSRGSCSGSGVLLDLILTGRAPAALVFCEAEDVLTLGALVAAEMFGKPLPVIRLSAEAFAALSTAATVTITNRAIASDTVTIALSPPATDTLALTDTDRAMLEGQEGEAVVQAMRIICAMAAQQGATSLIDVIQGHIDGCIYASPANLTFAETMAKTGAQVRIPTTMNAISVDYSNWQRQGVPQTFGAPAARLADAYVRMGCRPTFTCSPYLLDSAPKQGDAIAWAESNAVVFANSVLGARTAKHPDFLDLCIALTGRAPKTGVYLDANRRAERVINVDMPAAIDDAFWPLIGYLAGKAAPDCIALFTGLLDGAPSRNDLKALCAAFGTTSAAPMLHIEGVTPEADGAAIAGACSAKISRGDMIEAWRTLNEGPEDIELVAIGSPHASLEECRALADALTQALRGQPRRPDVTVIVTAGQQIIDDARRDGTLSRLQTAGVQILPDLCWCSISEPVFPTRTRAVMTNSAKYAHYGPGLSGRNVRFGSLASCVAAALTGKVKRELPSWLS
ncbi:putative aconitase/putative aconitase with swiveling domain [Pararhizobium capsulatum DSM 1112]|uniref:Aconitase/putative aconitase with swiveling domain n=1 Tax=Pararhizobium capsulatum DSM 1112 TaxID=1121113 RepID=A0ABU0BXV7_9HYPH|nr:aconitase X [Pararhizobium capsulatum]MDQ0322793.1 putative aconitase/putative aconitase with swiveling domain [Pararhizobium capsulatum DSM 1112]